MGTKIITICDRCDKEILPVERAEEFCQTSAVKINLEGIITGFISNDSTVGYFNLDTEKLLCRPCYKEFKKVLDKIFGKNVEEI